jgi:hypothetical protein
MRNVSERLHTSGIYFQLNLFGSLQGRLQKLGALVRLENWGFNFFLLNSKGIVILRAFFY